ncbi:MAG: hypothetical protein LBT55_06395 [Clostridiaceae bacterium]|jgi:hypothetical protein|nr:hypothetical protein [Clostridiaceae bacterium]
MSKLYDKNKDQLLVYMESNGHKPGEKEAALDTVANPSMDYDPSDKDKLAKMIHNGNRPFGGKSKGVVFTEFANRCVFHDGKTAKDADIFADAGLLHETGRSAVYSLNKKPEVGTVLRIGIALRLSTTEMEDWAELFDKSFTYDPLDCVLRVFMEQEAYTKQLSWGHKDYVRGKIWYKLYEFAEAAQVDFPTVNSQLLLTRNERKDT